MKAPVFIALLAVAALHAEPVQGVVSPNKQISLSSPVMQEIITEMLVEEGTEVREGQIIAQLRNEREKLILTMKAPYRDLSSLTGYSGDIVIKGVHPNGLTIKSRVPWGSGGMTVAYEGYCDAAELAKAPREFDSFAFVRPLLVTLGFSVLLMVAWLVAPRLIWKDESPVIQSLRKSKRRMGN